MDLLLLLLYFELLLVELKELTLVNLLLERTFHLDLELEFLLLRLLDLHLDTVDPSLLLLLPVIKVHAVVLCTD